MVNDIEQVDNIAPVTELSDGRVVGKVQYDKRLGLLIPFEFDRKIFYWVIQKEVLKEMLEDINGQDDLR